MAAPKTRLGAAVRRAGSWTVNLLLLGVVAACIAWLTPALFGYSHYVITGASMTGTYDKGSVVFEKPVPVADLEVGDVITYRPPADSGVPNLVTHRITGMKPAQGGGVLFDTKGDANPGPDPWHFKLVSSEQPVVQFGVPHVGWLFIALADRQTRMLLIGGPAALVGLFALGELAGALRKGSQEPGTPAAAPSESARIPAQRTSVDAFADA